MKYFTSCKRSLIANYSSNTTPKYAIANGLFIGMLPLEFKDTTNAEHVLLNRVQSSAFVRTAVGGCNRKMTFHTYSFRAEPTVPEAMLPRDLLESGEIKVGVAGSITTKIGSLKISILSVCNAVE